MNTYQKMLATGAIGLSAIVGACNKERAPEPPLNLGTAESHVRHLAQMEINRSGLPVGIISERKGQTRYTAILDDNSKVLNLEATENPDGCDGRNYVFSNEGVQFSRQFQHPGEPNTCGYTRPTTQLTDEQRREAATGLFAIIGKYL